MAAYEVSLPFAEPVSTKIAPDYYEIIKRPMDLKTIRNKIKTFDYRSREEFLTDVRQMVENCHLYNGPSHLLSAHADNILQVAINSVTKVRKIFFIFSLIIFIETKRIGGFRESADGA
jgi:hypothetical protein